MQLSLPLRTTAPETTVSREAASRDSTVRPCHAPSRVLRRASHPSVRLVHAEAAAAPTRRLSGRPARCDRCQRHARSPGRLRQLVYLGSEGGGPGCYSGSAEWFPGGGERLPNHATSDPPFRLAGGFQRPSALDAPLCDRATLADALTRRRAARAAIWPRMHHEVGVSSACSPKPVTPALRTSLCRAPKHGTERAQPRFREL